MATRCRAWENVAIRLSGVHMGQRRVDKTAITEGSGPGGNLAQDPDKLLQRLIDATSAELRRIRANVKANRNGTLYNGDEILLENQRTCPMCRRDFGLSTHESKWLIEAGKLIASVAFGARKMVAEKMLKALTDGGLAQFADAMEQRERDGKWMPDV